jgi:RecA-family ATPase
VNLYDYNNFKQTALTVKDIILKPPEKEEPLWIFQNSLLKGSLGMILGPPGIGKGLFTAAMIISLASGLPLYNNWYPTKRFKVMAIFADDDLNVLHFRLHEAQKSVPLEIVEKMDYKIGSYKGNVSLIGKFRLLGDKKKAIMTTPFLEPFLEHVKEYSPEILILDPLSRFIKGNPNTLALMNETLLLMDYIGREVSCNVILCHHTNYEVNSMIEWVMLFGNNDSYTFAHVSRKCFGPKEKYVNLYNNGKILIPLSVKNR